MVLNATTKKQFVRYVVSGVFAVAVDFGIYLFLNSYLDYGLSKAISFMSGTTVAYLLNRFWTFETKVFLARQLFKFLLLYGISLVVNVLINMVVLKLTNHVMLGFLISSAVSIVINFSGQKFWVFKK